MRHCPVADRAGPASRANARNTGGVTRQRPAALTQRGRLRRNIGVRPGGRPACTRTIDMRSPVPAPPVGWPAGPPHPQGPPAAGPRPCRRRRKNHRSSSSTSGTAFPRRTLRVHLVPRHGGDGGLPRRRRAGRRDRHPRTERRGHRPDERASQTRTQSTTMDCSAQDPSGGPAHPPTATLSTGV